MRVAVVALALALALLAASPAAVAQSDDLQVEGVTLDVHVEGSGDAAWNVSTSIALADDTDREAFRRLADDVENGSDPPGFDVETVEAAVASGERKTGREMSLTGVDRSARVVENGTRGVIALTFMWENFGEVDGDRVTVGDAFTGWTLTETQRLRLHPPGNFGLLDVEPNADAFDDGTLTWQGEQSFGAGEPSVTYARSVSPPTETATPTETPTSSIPGGADLGFLAAVAGLLLLGGVVAYAAVRGDHLFDGDVTGTAGNERGGEPAPETAPADGGGTTGGAESGGEDDGEGGDGAVDPTLLSDEERVERLLEEHGGRMKQADVVTETGWSNAKVSQLLSGMADDDRVEKLRIGRENLISLPGAEGDDGE